MSSSYIPLRGFAGEEDSEGAGHLVESSPSSESKRLQTFLYALAWIISMGGALAVGYLLQGATHQDGGSDPQHPCAVNNVDSACWQQVKTDTPMIISVEVEPYWIARLISEDNKTIVPIFQHSSSPRQGTLMAPFPGRWHLTVQTPQGPADASNEADPSFCFIFRLLAVDLERWALVSSLGRRIFDFCARTPGYPWNRGHAFTANEAQVPVPTLDDSPIVDRWITVVAASRGVSNVTAAVSQAAGLLHGSASRLFPDGGRDSIGYWERNGRDSSEVGSEDFAPTNLTCELRVSQDNPVCATPTWRWRHYARPRRQWLLGPDSLKKCAKDRKIVVMGDSLGSQLVQGLKCLLGGYAGLHWSEYNVILAHR